MLELVKVLFPWTISFFIGLIITPFILSNLYKYKAWRRNSNSKDAIMDEDGKILEIINKNEKDMKTPRMGGLVIVFSTLITIFLFWIYSFFSTGNTSGFFDILSRKETWLPLAAFVAGALVGAFDDYFTIRNSGKFKSGLPLRWRLVFVILFAIFASWWFYAKLNYDSIYLPFYGSIALGIWFVPFFITSFVATFATSTIDGLDGLSGGIMAVIYSMFGFIALYQDKLDISAFSFVIVGAILAFLWFNIPPAKFYMTEVGYNALSFALVIIAFMTNTILVLPIIAMPLLVTLISTVLQIIWIRAFGKRLFKIAPLHHHFEALGWEQSQIVMRYWIVSIIFGILGLIVAIVGIPK